MDNMRVYPAGRQLSVCAKKELTMEELLKEINILRPTGVGRKWVVSGRKLNKDAPRPCGCRDEEKCIHFFLEY